MDSGAGPSKRREVGQVTSGLKRSAEYFRIDVPQERFITVGASNTKNSPEPTQFPDRTSGLPSLVNERAWPVLAGV